MGHLNVAEINPVTAVANGVKAVAHDCSLIVCNACKSECMFAGAGNLVFRRSKPMKTKALQTAPTLFVAESKMRTAVLANSARPGKKYEVRIGDKTVRIGAAGYEDYTTHKDPVRKASYLARHRNENWGDPETAGFWARWILWNKKTIGASIRDLRRLGIVVRF